MATRQEILKELQERGIDRVYGRALSRCVKDELESYLRTLSRTDDTKYYSYSQVNMMLRCGLQYYFRYLRGIKIPPSGALTVGRSFDDAANFNYEQKLSSGKDEPEGVLTDVFAETFEKLRHETDWQEGENPDQVKSQGVGLVKCFRNDVAPSVQPMLVQQDLFVGFEGEDFKFRVILDLVDAGNAVIDNKTAGRSYNQQAVDEDLQLTAQSFAFRSEYGVEESELGFDAVIKNKTPKAQRIRTKRTTQDHLRLLRYIAQVDQAIKKRVFLPAAPGHWACSPKYCGYWDICHEEV